MQEIKCPNCGAPAKNHKNCEFCGSLLVRFANKGIDLSNTTYLNNDAVLPGLIKQLEKNLDLQQNKENGLVKTVLSVEDERYIDDTRPICTVITSNGLVSDNAEIIFPNAELPSLAVAFSFRIYNSTIESKYPVYKEHRIQKDKFEQLNSFSLFDLYVSPNQTDENGDTYIQYLYAIDFGPDAEGAARLISEIANKVYGCPLNKPLIYETGTEREWKIKNAEIAEMQAAIQKEETKENIKKWIWIVLAALGFLLWLIL